MDSRERSSMELGLTDRNLGGVRGRGWVRVVKLGLTERNLGGVAVN